MGKKVMVLGHHEIPGGWSQTFTLNGFHISPGVHYIGELHEEGWQRRVTEGPGVSKDISKPKAPTVISMPWMS